MIDAEFFRPLALVLDASRDVQQRQHDLGDDDSYDAELAGLVALVRDMARDLRESAEERGTLCVQTSALVEPRSRLPARKGRNLRKRTVGSSRHAQAASTQR